LGIGAFLETLHHEPGKVRVRVRVRDKGRGWLKLRFTSFSTSPPEFFLFQAKGV